MSEKSIEAPITVLAVIRDLGGSFAPVTHGVYRIPQEIVELYLKDPTNQQLVEWVKDQLEEITGAVVREYPEFKEAVFWGRVLDIETLAAIKVD